MSDNHAGTRADPVDDQRLAFLSIDEALVGLQRLAAAGASEEVIDRLFAQVSAYQQRGRARHVLALLDRRQEVLADDSLDPVALGWLLNERGTALSGVGAHDRASAAYDQMADLGRRLGDDELVSTAEQNLGNQAHLRGDHAAARLHFAEAARRKIANGDTYAAIQVLLNLTALDIDDGQLDDAERTLVGLQRVLRRAGAPHLSMTLNGNLALLAVKRRDFALAERHARRALHYARRSGDEAGEMRGLHTIGNIRLEVGDYRNALRWHRRALNLADLLDLPPLRLLAHQSMVAVLLHAARYREATTNLLAVQEIATELGDREAATHALADFGAATLRTGRVAEAVDILQEALRQTRALPDAEWEAQVLSNLAEAARLDGDDDAASNFIEEALRALPEGQERERADLLRRAARARFDDAATFEQGLAYLRRSLDAEATLGTDQSVRAWAYSQAAAELAQRGERRSTDASVAFYDQALRLYEAGGEEAMAFHIRNDRAIALTALGRYEEALADYRDCLATAARRADRVMAQQAAGNLGESLSQSGASTEALPLLERALALARELGDARGQADALGSLGLALGKLGEVAAAEQRFTEALALGQSAELPTAEAVALGGLALVAFERADYALARDRYTAAAAIEERLGDRRHLAESLGGVVESLAALGKTEALSVPAQRLVDLAQAIGAEELASDSLARAGRWYLERADIDQAAELYAASLAGAAVILAAGSEERGVTALAHAAVTLALHAREGSVADPSALFTRVTALLDERYEGSGAALGPLLAAAREQLAPGERDQAADVPEGIMS